MQPTICIAPLKIQKPKKQQLDLHNADYDSPRLVSDGGRCEQRQRMYCYYCYSFFSLFPRSKEE